MFDYDWVYFTDALSEGKYYSEDWKGSRANIKSILARLTHMERYELYLETKQMFNGYHRATLRTPVSEAMR